MHIIDNQHNGILIISAGYYSVNQITQHNSADAHRYRMQL